MKKRIFTAFLFLILCLFALGACSKSSGGSDAQDSIAQEPEGGKDDADDAQDADDTDDAENDNDILVIDLDTEDGIRDYLAGKWTMINRDTGEDFATLDLKSSGEFVFTRIDDGAKGEGLLSFDHMMAKDKEMPDYFKLSFDKMKELLPESFADVDDGGVGYESDGIFHIGSANGRDYLYLKEIGNGDTMISCFALNIYKDMYDPDKWTPEWLFYREDDSDSEGTIQKDSTFYAWAWESDGNGLWLEPMAVHEYETNEDYTNRRFMGGYFSEDEEISAAYYPTDDADIEEIIEARRYNADYPLMMYEVETDDKGSIESIREVDQAFYNVYDMGEIEPEYSYNGTTFVINGVELNVRDYVPAVNAIVDAVKVGDWIILDCHINPDFGMYEFYNINYGDIMYEIQGANLIWRGDDLSTVVYSLHDQVFDIWGHMIGWVDEGEVYSLKWLDDTTVGAECWMVDGSGNEKEFTKKFEHDPEDLAVWSCYEYLLGGARQWRRFVGDSPKDALALVMVNPPEKILTMMPTSKEIDQGAFDRVVILSLYDDEQISIDSSRPGGRMTHEEKKLDRGQIAVYRMTVPEGVPDRKVTVSVPGRGEAEWDVMTLSGKKPLISMFVVSK